MTYRGRKSQPGGGLGAVVPVGLIMLALPEPLTALGQTAVLAGAVGGGLGLTWLTGAYARYRRRRRRFQRVLVAEGAWRSGWVPARRSESNASAPPKPPAST